MEISSKYNPATTEEKWYKHWMDKVYFHSEPDKREPYTIVIPPPNVTGVLHMGHMLNNTIQDVLIRRARMMGKNALWVPGTDHASIATEAKVVSKLKEQGILKADLSREKFLEHAWEWTHKHGGIILEQLKKLGASCDWDRTKFTMDEDMSESVLQVFVDLYNKGLIYRGFRMVNWDPEAKTTVSDEEVIYKESQGKLYTLRYQIEGEDDFVSIATTRPETILGDTAICYNPSDERFQHLKGKRAIVPIANRSIPLIADDYVDMEFGTGCLKITPAHDPNDKTIGDKYKLEFIDIFNDDGSLNDHGLHYKGMDRFVCRREILKELEQTGSLVKTEDYQNKIGTSERTGAVIEPKLSYQWFLAMEKLASPALKAVMEDEVKLVPEKFKNTYRHWMENVRDWNISRQLWWGHRIPAWFYGEGMEDFVVAMNQNEALENARKKTGNPALTLTDLKQDDDVLDTWFSSWLWPISVFDGIRNPENPEIKYYYPTNDLVTAPEILFFWVARMIIAGYEWQNEKPFRSVYLTGIVRDKLGRKMSKSLGNSPDPIELMNKYGADGVRVGMLLTSPAGNDLPFDEALCEQGRNFSNKIWNALRLVKGWQVDQNATQDANAALAVAWFRARFNQSLGQMEDHFSKYRLSDALMAAYKLTWDDFCSWYLEMIKPPMNQPIDSKTYQETLRFFEDLMKILHPFMPFISEEIWHLLADRKEGDDLIIASMPKAEAADISLLEGFDFAAEMINGIRKVRAEKNIPYRDPLEVLIIDNNKDFNPRFEGLIARLCNLKTIAQTAQVAEGTFGFRVKATEVYIPLNESIDVEAELKKLKEELHYTRGFLVAVDKKLKNERFMSGAPEQVVEREQKKKSDAESRIQLIEQQIKALS
ncbi:MAG: valine--tRNA ligase [Bacteroidetes bacterium]|nr:valine--tRNA ligase [Bacteroidota bacterium]MBU1577822.1 valine--tRNA ligase [Bacteroidota bacterium]MBU2465915.1 valine--tRNA ligase [Bacteroidota bacterium]MBU2559084.1 valine--tRNA ligase [Bacteroidota bacterium]